MSPKAIITFGMIVGSIAGGYLSMWLGADAISFASLIASTAGAFLGIWIGYRFSELLR
jgi:uncharacterized membrane protein YoaK (UPF0700 family)